VPGRAGPLAAVLVAVAVALPSGAAADTPRVATLVAAGDIACDAKIPPSPSRCRHAYTAEIVKALAPDVVATVGDAQSEDGKLSTYLGSYHPTWGAFRSITRPALGNHEYMASPDRRSAPGHFGYFGKRAGPRRGYYTYRLAGWRIVVLNSGMLDFAKRSRGIRDDCFPVSCAWRSRQVRWLRRLMNGLTPNRCVLAYWHHARFSSASPGPSEELRHVYRALYEGGAELALSAHSHSYERFGPMDGAGRLRRRGVRQFVVGTGGTGRVPVPDRLHRGSRHFDRSRALGVLELTLRPGRYAFRFVREDGTTLDRGRGGCHRRPERSEERRERRS
jgi:acid phosphatase type 7